jgi:L-asparaginase / beta-aspartyl-peptidase
VAGLQASLAAGWAVLDAGGSALDATVAAVVSMEDSGIFNAGRGAVPTTAGQVETDAGVMGLSPDGDGWREVAGAACAMLYPANPIRAALAVAEGADALLLAGPGADAFAAQAGLAARDDSLLTHGGVAPISQMGTVGAPSQMGTVGAPSQLGTVGAPSQMGTVGAVALDAAGHLGAATSTGGRGGQPPGRVGDSPVIGAGTWAAGGGVAVSGTGDGEAFIQAGFAHRIDAVVRAGGTLKDAGRDAMAAVERWRGVGGAVVVDEAGRLLVMCDTPAMAMGWRSATLEHATVLRATDALPPGA